MRTQKDYKPPILAEEIPKRVKNWNKLNPQQQMRRAWEEISKDFYLYCEKNFFITNKRGELVKLRPNAAQRALVDAVMDDLKHGRPVRYIVLKARQMGLSTIIEALCYWYAATHKYVSAAIVAHDREGSNTIYQIFQRYYDNSDTAFRPATKYYTKNDLTFDNDKGTGIKSQIRTAVAKKEGTGRGQTNRFVHGSEVAFWEDSADIVSSLLQTVPLLPDTFIFLESTANGMGGYFYDTWMKAKKGEGSFKPFFFAWHEHDEYELNIPKNVRFTPEQKEWLKDLKDFGYPDLRARRKLLWRIEKAKEFVHDPDKWYQEYPSTDLEAFISSGRPVFAGKVLMKMDRVADGVKFQMYDLEGDFKEVHPIIIDFPFDTLRKMQGLRVWELPKKGDPMVKIPANRYVIGADVAEGIEVKGDEGKESDYSVATVMDRATRKTVARYRGHIDPDKFGDFLCLLGWWYNEATIAVEVNNQGLATVQRLRDRLYKKLYMRESGFDELFEEPTAKMGWRTDKASKYIMITDLAKAIRDYDIIDYDQVFIRECMTYVRDESGRTNAQEGHHDDTVMATAIALQLFDWKQIDRDPPSVKKSQHYQSRIKTEAKIAPRFGIYKRATKIKSYR